MEPSAGGRGKHSSRGRGWGRERGRGRGHVTSFNEKEKTIDVSTQMYQRRRGLIGDAEELCERHVAGCCASRVCSGLHNQKKAPYVWQYRRQSEEWKLLSNIEMEDVEEDFCGNLDHTTTQIKRFGKMIARVSVNLTKVLNPPSATSKNVTIFRRLSTRSYAEAGSDDISLYTQWIWYWKENNSEWKPFQRPKLQVTLETKYLGGQDCYHYDIGDHSYRLDFNTMIQRNLKYQTQRSVHRRPAFFTLEDIRSGKRTCSSLVMPPPAPVVDVPSLWSPLDFYQYCEKVELDHGSEFTYVTSLFFKTLNKGKCYVNEVFRIQNQFLWHSFCSMKKTMQLVHGKDEVDERQLFHGTDSLDVINNICINNFDFRVSGKNATVYGKGAYFARDASYSHHYTAGSVRYMFLARVLVGCFTQGNGNYTRPPPRKGHALFDSCVNDVTDPSIFIIFERNQCYPEYLITYTDTRNTATSKQANVTAQRTHAAAAYTKTPIKPPVASAPSVSGQSVKPKMRTNTSGVNTQLQGVLNYAPVPTVTTRQGSGTVFSTIATNQGSGTVSSAVTTRQGSGTVPSAITSRQSSDTVFRAKTTHQVSGTVSCAVMTRQGSGTVSSAITTRQGSGTVDHAMMTRQKANTVSRAITMRQGSDTVSGAKTTHQRSESDTVSSVIATHQGSGAVANAMTTRQGSDTVSSAITTRQGLDTASSTITTRQGLDTVSSTITTSAVVSQPRLPPKRSHKTEVTVRKQAMMTDQNNSATTAPEISRQTTVTKVTPRDISSVCCADGSLKYSQTDSNYPKIQPDPNTSGATSKQILFGQITSATNVNGSTSDQSAPDSFKSQTITSSVADLPSAITKDSTQPRRRSPCESCTVC